MPSPVTANDVVVPDPSSSLCDNFKGALLENPITLKAFLNWLVDSDGNFNADIQKTIRDWSTPPGTIIMSGAITTPAGYLLCNGAAVSRETYADLFAAIGTTFGDGDGSTTFELPNFDERFATGTGVKVFGATGGGEATIEADHLPPHVHLDPWKAASVGGDGSVRDIWEDFGEGSEPVDGDHPCVDNSDSQTTTRVHPYVQANETDHDPLPIEPKYLVVKFFVKT